MIYRKRLIRRTGLIILYLVEYLCNNIDHTCTPLAILIGYCMKIKTDSSDWQSVLA